jgi:hypothetical protein
VSAATASKCFVMLRSESVGGAAGAVRIVGGLVVVSAKGGVG